MRFLKALNGLQRAGFDWGEHPNYILRRLGWQPLEDEAGSMESLALEVLTPRQLSTLPAFVQEAPEEMRHSLSLCLHTEHLNDPALLLSMDENDQINLLYKAHDKLPFGAFLFLKDWLRQNVATETLLSNRSYRKRSASPESQTHRAPWQCSPSPLPLSNSFAAVPPPNEYSRPSQGGGATPHWVVPSSKWRCSIYQPIGGRQRLV